MVGLAYRVEAIGTGRKAIVRELGFTAGKGESIAIVGESGSGKTMLAMSIMGLLPPGIRADGLSITLDGTEISSLSEKRMAALRGRQLVYIPQSGLDSLNPSQTVRRHIEDGLRAAHIPRPERRELTQKALEQVGLDPREVLGLYPFELSGGMAQKVILALSSFGNALLVIADEPTNGLDPESQAAYTQLLASMFRNAVKLIITHDISLASSCDCVMVMCGGSIVEYGPAGQVLASPRHPYTRALIESLPENGLIASPVLREAAGSCPFYPRCKHVSEACLGSCKRFADESGHFTRCQNA